MVEVTTFPLRRCILLELLSRFLMDHAGAPIHHRMDGGGGLRSRTIMLLEDTNGDGEL
jgi:hypothetical protein